MFNAAYEKSLELTFFNITDGILVFYLFKAFFQFYQFILLFSDLIGVISFQDLNVVSCFLFHFVKTKFWVEDDV